MVEELRQEMQKLSNYKAAQQKLAGMETLGDEPKRAQVKTNGASSLAARGHAGRARFEQRNFSRGQRIAPVLSRES